MKTFWKIILTAFLVACSPIGSAPSLYSSDRLKISEFSDENIQIPGLKYESLKLIFDSITCKNFEDRVWHHLYIILFKNSLPPSPSLLKKKIKSYAKNYFAQRNAGPKLIRDFSNDFSQIYAIALEFFSNKSEETILEELSQIEKMRSAPLSQNEPLYVFEFLNKIQSILKNLTLMSHALDLDCLTENAPIFHDITFHRGMNIFEMADLLHERKLIPRKKFLHICQNKELIFSLLGENLESIEGYLYPGSYSFSKEDRPSVLIQSMVQKFLKIYNNLSYSVKIPKHHAVILASMVEKEALLNKEKPTIASVFHNRLRINMKLQSDPTISYGIWKATGKNPGKVRKKDISTKTKYNTYHVKGLPVGPISNPGRHSLHAVLNPKKTPFYYFVSNNGRTHIFSSNYEDHKKAIKKR